MYYYRLGPLSDHFSDYTFCDVPFRLRQPAVGPREVKVSDLSIWTCSRDLWLSSFDSWNVSRTTCNVSRLGPFVRVCSFTYLQSFIGLGSANIMNDSKQKGTNSQHWSATRYGAPLPSWRHEFESQPQHGVFSGDKLWSFEYNILSIVTSHIMWLT